MRRQRPLLLGIIAVMQIVPILILPPQLLSSVNWLWLLLPVPLFAVLGWALLMLRPVARMLTVFLQGFNIIVRLLITLARIVPSKAPGTPVDTPLLLTSLVSIAISTLILYYVDQPEMQLLFAS